MKITQSTYEKIRPLMKPGDIIAFSGKGFVSDAIKRVTGYPISHVGMVMQTRLLIGGIPQQGKLNQIVESTTLNETTGLKGVSITRLSERLLHYDGEVYWLPLATNRRKAGDWKKAFDFLLKQEHVRYDRKSIIHMWLQKRLPFLAPLVQEDPNAFFCSELLVAALLETGILPNNIIPANATPADLCQYAIYQKRIVQIQGAARGELPLYNTRQVGGAIAASTPADVVEPETEGILTSSLNN